MSILTASYCTDLAENVKEKKFVKSKGFLYKKIPRFYTWWNEGGIGMLFPNFGTQHPQAVVVNKEYETWHLIPPS
jgi:hypothetical protein